MYIILFLSLNVVIHLDRSIYLVFIWNLKGNRLALLILCGIEMEFGIVGGECAIAETAHPRWDVVDNGYNSLLFLKYTLLLYPTSSSISTMFSATFLANPSFHLRYHRRIPLFQELWEYQLGIFFLRVEHQSIQGVFDIGHWFLSAWLQPHSRR